MTDLVNRLRSHNPDWPVSAATEDLLLDAADEIERLRAVLRLVVSSYMAPGRSCFALDAAKAALAERGK